MPSPMGRFWDGRAAENPFFFVDNRLDYRRPDLERFWADGERDLDALLASLGASLRPTDQVLEIGCGIGRLTRVLAARCAWVCAVDVSERMLESARRHNPRLANVEWLRGDGVSLSGMQTASVDACVSHVVFQHIPDPEITLGYIREMGRVLRPLGWTAFQISNDPDVHRPPPAWRSAIQSARALTGRRPRGQHDRNWLGSMVELDAVSEAAREGSMEVERIVGEGTQLCAILARRVDPAR